MSDVTMPGALIASSCSAAAKSVPGALSPVAALCQYNRALLLQGFELIDRLQTEAHASFNYAKAVGPHLRHVIEHYQALLDTLANANSSCVDYDARSRALDVQSQSAVTQQRLQSLMQDLNAMAADPGLRLDTPLTTRLQAGPAGEMALEVLTTLGRELLFVASHSTHHYALLAHYCEAAGVSVGVDFGKAPSTVAFERRQAAA
jgi:hypothetical protein